MDLELIKNRILIKYPFYEGIIARVKFIEDDTCYDYNGNPTAGTDGKSIYYHKEFMNSLDEDEQLFIITHEISHIAKDHIRRGEKKDPEVWNVAADAIINISLVHEGLKMVDGAIYIENAMQYDVETLYEELIKNKNNLPKCNNHNIWNRKYNQDKSSKEMDKVLENEIEKISKLS